MVVLELEREELREERKEEGASQSLAMTPGSSRTWRGPNVKVSERKGGGGGREGGKKSYPLLFVTSCSPGRPPLTILALLPSFSPSLLLSPQTLEWTIEVLKASSSSSSSSSSTAARVWGLRAAVTKATAVLNSSSSKKRSLGKKKGGVELLDLEGGGLPLAKVGRLLPHSLPPSPPFSTALPSTSSLPFSPTSPLPPSLSPSLPPSSSGAPNEGEEGSLEGYCWKDAIRGIHGHHGAQW